MTRLIKIVLFLWVLLVYMLIVGISGKGFPHWLEVVLLIFFTFITITVLTLLVT